MSELLPILLSFIAYVFLGSVLLAKYGRFSLLHPGLSFAGAWGVSMSAYLLLVYDGTWRVYDASALREMVIFTLVVSAAFILPALISKKQAKAAINNRLLDFAFPSRTYTLFCTLSLAAAFANWFVLGADISGVEARRQAWLSEIPKVTARLWYPYLLCHPLALISGWTLCRPGRTTSLQKVALLLPLVSGFLWYLGTGGRHSFVVVASHFAFGALISLVSTPQQLPSMWRPRLLRGLLLFCSLVAVVVVVMSVTAAWRAQYQGVSNERTGRLKFIQPYSHPIEYAGTGIAAYQEDSLWREGKRELGVNTFGIFRIIRLDRVLGWPEVESNYEAVREKVRLGFELAYAWPTLLGNLVQDFGFVPALVIACAAALLSHFIFMKTLSGRRKLLLLSCVPLFASLKFWGESPAFSVFKDKEIFWVLVSYCLFDVSVRIVDTYTVTLGKAKTQMRRNGSKATKRVSKKPELDNKKASLDASR